MLPTLPDRIATVTDFPVFGADSEEPELHDIAFVTGQGRISVVDIPADAGVYPAKTSIEIPSGVRTKHIQVDRNAKVAYIAATNDDDEQIRCDYLLVVDVSQPFTIIGDNNNDGWDDRVIGKIRITIPGYVGPVYLQGFRLDTKKGLIYAGLYAGGDQGLAIIKVWECPDVGVDFKSAPRSLPVASEVEKKALQEVIRSGLLEAQLSCGIEPDTLTMIEQGSGSCIWNESCDSNYQPGFSDHDFEVFFPPDVDEETQQCVINALYNQVMTIQSDPIPIEAFGYKVYFKDISFYPMNREDFESALLSINRPAGTMGDTIDDMGLGRQQLLLKWLVEGSYVEVPGLDLKGMDFRQILEELKKPMDVDGDGHEDEPSHIPRLEGYEWAKLQEANIYRSGALIRLHGSSKLGTTLHETFKKDLHKVAKAGIRAVLALIIANDEGNKLAVNFECDVPPCVDVSQSDSPYAWERDVPCESFAHYIASIAARMVRDHPEENLFTPEEIQDIIFRFYRIKSGDEEITTEEEAVEFITEAVQFVEAVKNQTITIYNQTIGIDPRKSQRNDNMSYVENKINEYTSNGKKHIIPRFFNKGTSTDEDLYARMYMDGQEQKYENIIVEGGDYIHLDTRKDPPPDNDDPDVLLKPRKNVPVFSLNVDQSDPKNGWVNFFIDIPDRKVQEADRENNWARVFYYILDPDNPYIPSLPQEPELEETIGEPEDDLLEAAPVCGCPKPKVRVVISVAGSDATTLYIGGEPVFAELLIENLSDQLLRNVKIFNVFDMTEPIEEFSEIPIGESKLVTVTYWPSDQPGEINRQILVEFEDEDGIIRGIGSNSLNLETKCPIALIAVDPNPNPETSEIMYGGTFCRYYRVVDRSQNGAPVPDVTIKACLCVGDQCIEEPGYKYRTDEDGYLITRTLTEETALGMCVDFDFLENFLELPVDSPYPIKAELSIDKIWLQAAMPNKCISDPITFDVNVRKFDFEEVFRAGASTSKEGSLAVVSGSLRDGSSIDLLLAGHKQGDHQEFDKLAVRRNETFLEELSFKIDVDLLEVKTPFAELKVKAFKAGKKRPIVINTGDQYEFPVAETTMKDFDMLKSAGLILDVVIDSGSPHLTTFMMMRKLNHLILDDFTEQKSSEFWGVTDASSGGIEILNVNAKANLGVINPYVNVSAFNAATSTVSTLENEHFLKENKTIRRCEFAGKFDSKSGLDAGLEAVLSKTEDGKTQDTLKAEHKKLLETSHGSMSRGMKTSMILNESGLPERLEASFLGKKEHGWALDLFGTFVDLGDGENFNITYSLKNLKDIVTVLKNNGRIRIFS